MYIYPSTFSHIPILRSIPALCPPSMSHVSSTILIFTFALPCFLQIPFLSHFLWPSCVATAIGDEKVAATAREVPYLLSSCKDARDRFLGAGGKVLIVSKDGEGQFHSISDAINSITERGRVVIRIKAGVYEEYLTITRENITFVGDGIDKSIIQSRRSDASGHSIQDSGALERFIAVNITFANAAGLANGRGVALRSETNYSAFYHCSFTGFQDTLYVKFGVQFFRECEIEGTIDFIFGDAAVVFQNCTIKARRPKRGRSDVITAQGRVRKEHNTGISIQGCRLIAAEELEAKGYLGRPWKKFSRTAFMHTYIGRFIDPSGWREMNGTQFLDTLVYREYANFGPGAVTGRRVHWPGYKVMNETEARGYTASQLIDGESWLPNTGIPFILDI